MSYLHGLGFAHADIKPGHIFLGFHGGEFLLGDHGSLVEFGKLTHSTHAYVPSDARAQEGRQEASAALDWWMLATLLEKTGVEITMMTNWKKQKVKSEIDKIAFLKELSALLEKDL